MPPKDEWSSVADDIASELDNDAKVLAGQLFGATGPEYQRRPDSEIAGHLLSAYQRGDRTFLTKLAIQGPDQFLRVWKSLGGTVPDVQARKPI